jgi:ATP-dependent DNA helicase RecG
MSDLKSFLKTTPLYIKLLTNNGINTVRDFFNYFPRAYENRASIKPLNQLVFDEKWVTSTKGKILSKKVFVRNWKRIYDISFEDELGNLWSISIFNSWYLASKLIEWCWYIIVWKPTFKYNKIIFSHPDIVPSWDSWDSWEIEEFYNTWRIFPIYSEMNGIKPWWFAKKTWEHLNDIPEYFSEYLPEEFLKEFKLLDVQKTIQNIHYPDNENLKQQAIHRVFFDRLLRIQIFSLMNKLTYQSNNKVISTDQQREILKEMLQHIPFELTHAQKKVVKQIIDDFHSWKPMIRLLQWDVGSWKTIVATLAAFYLKKVLWGQTVFLAPLEVLAQQHYQSVARLLLPLWMRVGLLTGSLTKWQKDKIKSDLKQWKIDVIIWTHALLQEWIDFHNLQYVIIDEQHKFWVKQRAFFKKFWSPHILQMSATPIPRSMAIAFFWEFDVSIIDELPKGRLPIKTKIISTSETAKLKPWILDKINKWQKIFIVTPLIEESETLDEVQSVTAEYENMVALYPELKWKIWLLHWKMKPKEKDEVMKNFKNGKYVMLVSTTVIEVWVDVPEATVMIIRNSERFWLAQLHQLRWRIWRSDIQSYCFLETPKKSWDSYERLKAMEQTTDGFKLAELDLQNRWSWEILGTMQSWMSDIPIDILSDMKFLETVQQWAMWLLKKYPNLDGLPWLQKFLNEKIGDILA